MTQPSRTSTNNSVRAASTLFRERGIDGVGVAEISKEAGLTHGALYAQFASKDALAAEAFAAGGNRVYKKMLADGNASVDELIGAYISKRHRDDAADGCPIAASGSEVGRKDKAVSAAFAASVERMVAAMEGAIDERVPPAVRRERALAMVAGKIGAVIVARGLAKAKPRLSDEMLASARAVLTEIGGSPRRRSRSR